MGQRSCFGGHGWFPWPGEVNWPGSALGAARTAESSHAAAAGAAARGQLTRVQLDLVPPGKEQVTSGNCHRLNLSQVPVPLKDNRKRFLAMKWMITECRENKHRRTMMPEKLSQELLQAFNNEGPIVKKKHALHKMAEANRAYAHFRWW